MAKQGFKYDTDPYIYQEVSSGVSVAVGLDNSDGDKFKIVTSSSAGANPSGSEQLTIDPSANGNITLTPDGTGSVIINNGSSDTFEMRSTGEMTMGLNPAFFAYNNTLRSNITGDASAFFVIFEAVVFDQGSDYAAGSGIFTAPMDGIYSFQGQVCLSDFGGGVIDPRTLIYWTGGIDPGEYKDVSMTSLSGYIFLRFIYQVPLDAADTVRVRTDLNSGTKTVDMPATAYYTYFSGALIC